MYKPAAKFLIILLLPWMTAPSAVAQSDRAFPTGRYSEAGFIGTFTTDGKLIIEDADTAVIKAVGSYKIRDAEITVWDPDAQNACAHEGKYKWKFESSVLRFMLISDDCAGRVRHMTSQPWEPIR